MAEGFSSETERELRLILKKRWSEELHDALVAATTKCRRAARRQPTQNDALIRDEIRRDLSKLETSSSKAQAALKAIDAALRREIIATTRPWWPFSFGMWMAGFSALGRYATHARSALAQPAGRRPDPAKRRLAIAVERAFRTHGIRISNTREGSLRTNARRTPGGRGRSPRRPLASPAGTAAEEDIPHRLTIPKRSVAPQTSRWVAIHEPGPTAFPPARDPEGTWRGDLPPVVVPVLMRELGS